MEDGIICSQFIFYNNFDSANLARVEFVPQNESSVTKHSASNRSILPEIPDAEFNIWTKPDCFGTEFENGNRTWFYFGMKAPEASLLVRINMVDLNRQGKMYSQGMAPVYRILPLKPQWERVKEKPIYNVNDDIFTLTFKYRTPESTQHITYFAFTYPFSYTELDKMLINLDQKYLTMQPLSEDDIYYTRECICTSLEGRSIDLITITSYHGITNEREIRLKNLFKNKNCPRPFKFVGKKIVFISARVHPGETPSSFVFNGLLSLLLNRDDLTAITLRRLYVFKLIPFLNPDGVANGHYRTDTRGVNLNRVYRNPSLMEHPSVYAARALIRYYHFGFEKDDQIDKCDNCIVQNDNISQQVSHMSLDEDKTDIKTLCWKCKNNLTNTDTTTTLITSTSTQNMSIIGRDICRNCGCKIDKDEPEEHVKLQNVTSHGDVNCNESGIFLYCDLHGHASKKGIFMYGNHFNDIDRSIECMLLPKLMSINNHNFHFNACNFTERNMYLRDKRDGMSRAGSGRVAVLSLTGIVRSYTLECNYNTGRIVNVLPPTIKENNAKTHTLPVPPKYTPQIYEEVGRSLCHSILDLSGQNPMSRLPNSEFHSLNGLREWLRLNCMNDIGVNNAKTTTNKVKVKKSSSLQSQGKSTRGMVLKTRPSLVKTVTKKIYRQSAPTERNCKEIYPTSTTPTVGMTQQQQQQQQQPSCSYSPSKSSIRLNKCFSLKSKIGGNRPKTKLTPQKVRLDMSTTTKKNIKETDVKQNVELHEICFIKSSEGKKVVAKYKNKDGDSIDEKLVVAWDGSNANPQIYTQKGRIMSAPISKSLSEPGTSKQQGIFRVHNFQRAPNYSKTKLKKHALRLLSSNSESINKVDKKKKKKLKAK